MIYIKKSKEADKYALVKTEIQAIYHENQGRYGYLRITMELHNRGYRINHKTVVEEDAFVLANIQELTLVENVYRESEVYSIPDTKELENILSIKSKKESV